MRSSMFIAQPTILSQSILQTHRHNSDRYQNSIWNDVTCMYVCMCVHVCTYVGVCVCVYVYVHVCIFSAQIEDCVSYFKLAQECQELRWYFCEECFKYQPPLPSLFTPVYSSLRFIAVSDVIVTITYWIINGSIAVPLDRWYASQLYYAKAHLVVCEDI
jgi:hypothetical protein